LAVAFGKGSEHDFTLLKRTVRGIHPDILLLADSGYQGICGIHRKSWIPNKKTKKKKLSAESKAENRQLSCLRICIEHVNRYIKRFKILSARYRNKRKRHSLRVSLICAVCNFLRG
jgi:hypothetical protein